MPKRDTKLKNPPLKLTSLLDLLEESSDYLKKSALVRVSKLGGPDLYVTGAYIADDRSYIRLTTSIGKIEIDEATNKEKSTPE